jgi:hypothetical protein
MKSLVMMTEKRDWLGECNDKGVPLEDFQLQFCARCLQPECTRSLHGKSQFEARVTEWEDRLFKHVPRMDEGDPRYAMISAQKFLDIDTSRPPEVGGSWVDPRDLEQPLPWEYEISSTKQVEAQTVADIEEQGSAPVEIREVHVRSPRMAPMNTPNRPGQMVGGKKVDKRPTVSVSDPWKAPKPAKPTEGPTGRVVPPGAKIRLDDGSGV